MSNIKIKICGIKTSTILDYCNKLNVDYFGLVFYKKSFRNINIKKACNLINLQKKKSINPVGVFVNHNLNELNELIKITNLRYIQLHGNENNDYIKKLKEKNNLIIIKAISIQNKNDLHQIRFFTQADLFLFDYKPKKNELPGGNAKSFDWSLLKDQNITKPWFISGGINKNNVNKLLENLTPYGIDISSGVEDKPGIKNINKIKDIVELING